MEFVWVHAESFLHSAASPFHSFVPTISTHISHRSTDCAVAGSASAPGAPPEAPLPVAAALTGKSTPSGACVYILPCADAPACTRTAALRIKTPGPHGSDALRRSEHAAQHSTACTRTAALRIKTSGPHGSDAPRRSEHAAQHSTACTPCTYQSRDPCGCTAATHAHGRFSLSR